MHFHAFELGAAGAINGNRLIAVVREGQVGNADIAAGHGREYPDIGNLDCRSGRLLAGDDQQADDGQGCETDHD
jgi:hypothetical protein